MSINLFRKNMMVSIKDMYLKSVCINIYNFFIWKSLRCIYFLKIKIVECLYKDEMGEIFKRKWVSRRIEKFIKFKKKLLT